ncbi:MULTISPECIES: hypothetical protein [unclassified Caballeronia]|uniref:hypothetical protein n=1 Tax=unclassified Caballeronia TaxID=2646786 RepID=UPI002027E083|nr:MULTISPECIES: hypothetical protein [unclassified Caballeronia]
MAVGRNVTTLAPGDEVMGFIGIVGAFATRAVVDAARLARKPASLGFLEAAAVPAASLNGLAGAARVWRVAGRSDSSDSCRSRWCGQRRCATCETGGRPRERHRVGRQSGLGAKPRRHGRDRLQPRTFCGAHIEI